MSNIDHAYRELPVELYKKDIAMYEGAEFISYQHHFVNAVKGEVYGFAVMNHYEFVRSGNGFLLPLYCCYEVGMELVDQDEHMNVFRLARSHQGDEYYRGGSGSPIADPEGQITSILIGRVPDTELLRATRQY